MLSKSEVDKIKQKYPKGTPIRLFKMAGEDQLPFGTEGKVKKVDDIGQIHVIWETGGMLALNPELDTFEIISPEEIVSEQKCKEFIDKVNKVLREIDYNRLNLSCNNENTDYASDTLLKMHHAFEEVYGEGYVEESYGMVMMPAVVRGRNTDVHGLAIVTLDLKSAGEHWGTIFLTPMGVLDQQSKELTAEQMNLLNKYYGPYDYWYTPLIERDIHVDFTTMPEQAANIRRKVDELLVAGEEPKMEGPT